MPRTSTSRRKAASGAAYRLDDQIGFLLRRAYQRASANLIGRIGEHDLTAPQFATLARLRELGQVSQNLLGRLVVMEPANIRDVVRRLGKRGLLRVRPDVNDGRQLLVSLTPRGRALVGKLIPRELDSTAETLEPLTAGERATLCKLLRRLADG